MRWIPARRGRPRRYPASSHGEPGPARVGCSRRRPRVRWRTVRTGPSPTGMRVPSGHHSTLARTSRLSMRVPIHRPIHAPILDPSRAPTRNPSLSPSPGLGRDGARTAPRRPPRTDPTRFRRCLTIRARGARARCAHATGDPRAARGGAIHPASAAALGASGVDGAGCGVGPRPGRGAPDRHRRVRRLASARMERRGAGGPGSGPMPDRTRDPTMAQHRPFRRRRRRRSARFPRGACADGGRRGRSVWIRSRC